ncbi:hypothetical protein GN244_ATG13792 [Phytophthora infestans]|uniref:Uncharacterized protein n=1 Tax=Phytophthora infestans TaxID=4787 RepID=A0A833SWH8_PHYIN|nr:hypothetical protein GN244_ATG13792 [Phytophthora infestans]KAF4140922.1 hypothetical protein GN958_ATG09770 [Phytophthora infestans]
MQKSIRLVDYRSLAARNKPNDRIQNTMVSRGKLDKTPLFHHMLLLFTDTVTEREVLMLLQKLRSTQSIKYRVNALERDVL